MLTHAFSCVPRLLVKDTTKRMKLADVPKHPWILQYTQSSSTSAAGTQGILHNSSSSSQVR